MMERAPKELTVERRERPVADQLKAIDRFEEKIANAVEVLEQLGAVKEKIDEFHRVAKNLENLMRSNVQPKEIVSGKKPSEANKESLTVKKGIQKPKTPDREVKAAIPKTPSAPPQKEVMPTALKAVPSAPPQKEVLAPTVGKGKNHERNKKRREKKKAVVKEALVSPSAVPLN